VVRGEKPVNLSHTLLFCMQHGMQLKFISRSDYKKMASAEFQHTLEEEFGKHIFVPEGGFSPQGVKGAKNITVFFNEENYTHICCAVGTATTVAGLLQGSGKTSEIIGFSVLKNMTDINQRLQQLKVDNAKNFIFNGNYDFGGYAKKTNELIAFMNTFYNDNKIPLDFVYTGKMMFGIYHLIKKDYFSPGSNILCIHTGGLQGNKSLPHGILNF
ncbi:MAG: 1-aminocyclopropane-1-carboxylate deaminase, partial [Ginsengibacter sp.]